MQIKSRSSVFNKLNTTSWQWVFNWVHGWLIFHGRGYIYRECSLISCSASYGLTPRKEQTSVRSSTCLVWLMLTYFIAPRATELILRDFFFQSTPTWWKRTKQIYLLCPVGLAVEPLPSDIPLFCEAYRNLFIPSSIYHHQKWPSLSISTLIIQASAT